MANIKINFLKYIIFLIYHLTCTLGSQVFANKIEGNTTFSNSNENLNPNKITPLKGCEALKTFTQDYNGWGNSSKSSEAVTYLSTNFSKAFPNGISIGSSSRGLILSNSKAISSFLPSMEISKVLPIGTIIDPGKGYENELAGELVAAKLNVGFDSYDKSFSKSARNLKDMYCNLGSSNIKGKTVAELILIADNLIGGTVSSKQDFVDELILVLKKLNDFYSSNNTYLTKNYFVCEMPTMINSIDLGNNKGILETEKISNEFNVYPNPAKFEFVMKFSSEVNSIGSLKLIDLAGNIISEESVYVNTGDNFYKVDLLSKAIKASMVTVEFKYNNEIKRNIVIVK